ncbi:MAG: acyl-CoA dehydrogenase [Actinomycetota bacterium]|nr:acyl-CoA dehydrogenase [Actinomycetota bacterium]
MSAFAADALVAETVDRLLLDLCSPDVVEHADAEGWAPTLWNAFSESGFPWVSVPDTAGGSGGTLGDAAAILHAIGRYAAPVPVAETGMLAGWLLAGAGLEIPSGAATVATGLALNGGRLTGDATVAWGARSERIVALVADGAAWKVASVPTSALSISRGANLAGEPRDLVHADVAGADFDLAAAADGVDADALLQRGALSRVIMSAGALRALTQMTIDYTNERKQFGKQIAGFQAVQQFLVNTAQCAVRVNMAAERATRALAAGDAGITIAAAKVLTDAAVAEGTRAAHQAHGAMGVTREYPLHQLSRRLWAWRQEYGTATTWRRRLGTAAHQAGANGLFQLVTG